MEAFRYKGLAPDHFRLVTIVPGEPSETITLLIRTYSFGSAPEYTALSYCWGEEAPDQDCYVHENGSIAYVTVTSTVLDFLRRARHVSRGCNVWIDQVCINQASYADRHHQVRLMRRIYSEALNVMVWLGQADEDIGLAFRLVKDLWAPIARHDSGNPQLYWQVVTDSYGEMNSPLHRSRNDADWRALRKLLTNEYFSRTWIVQEVALAKTVYLCWGPHNMDLSVLLVVCEVTRSWDQRDSWDQRHREDQNHLTIETKSLSFLNWIQIALNDPVSSSHLEIRFENVLKAIMAHKSSIGHDKIYGILGLVRDFDVSDFPVDYNLKLRELFAYTTKLVIWNCQDLGLLCMNQIVPGRRAAISATDLPSWVPDYRLDDTAMQNRRVYQGARFMLHGCDRMYNATGSSRAGVQRPEVRQYRKPEAELEERVDLRLRLRGIRLGTIKTLSEVEQNGVGPPLDPIVLRGGAWSEFCLEAVGADGLYEATGEGADRVYERTRTWDRLPIEMDSAARRARLAQPHDTWVFPEPLVNSWSETPHGNWRFVDGEPGDVTGYIHACTTHQRLMILDNKFLGLCHRSCIAKDEVWLVMGSAVPYILRPLSTGMYMFKGEAYVHGAMDGEFLLRNFKDQSVSTNLMDDAAWLDSLAVTIPFATEEIVLI